MNLNEVLKLRDSGLSLIPHRAGSKAPAIAWADYQKRKPTDAELADWVSRYAGLGIICGEISGGLEVLDIESIAPLKEFRDHVERVAPGLLARLPRSRTPSGGRHLPYRCATIEGNQKLAQRKVGNEIKTLIETRGEGGLVLSHLSAPEVHPSGKPYIMLHGKLTAIPTITAKERQVLLDAARAMNEYVEPRRMVGAREAKTEKPGEDFNSRSDVHPRVSELLVEHGWAKFGDGRVGEWWSRPGVNDHSSATLFPDGGLYIFSSNASPFECNKGYSPFAIFTELKHAGDYSAAARDLGTLGYGAQSQSDSHSRGNSFVSFVGSKGNSGPEPMPWPSLNPAALYGIAGEFVRLLEPHTESDPVALLMQYLSAFGSVVGRKPHFKIEADTHYLNIFSVEVGETGTGRKGTSWNQVRRRFEAVDEDWNRECVVSGLSSGEGLLYHVRDPIIRFKKNRKTGFDQEEVVDHGVTDKRLFTFEGELGGVLRASAREGNTLSAAIRNLWDTGTARSLVKNSPIRTTDAHVSINGHIVRYELLSLLSECESINGFANRFLWLCVRRSKFLPRGGQSSNLNFNHVTRNLRMAVQFAAEVGEMTLAEEAWELWDSVYMRLETGRSGFLGKVTQRASPYTLRLACLYALLDCEAVVSVNHLQAALALWQYAEDSARYIFGARTGDKLADEVMAALQSASETGMTQTELNDYFHRNEDSEAIARALQMLAGTGQVQSLEERTGKPGRPTTRWFLTSQTNELNELNTSRGTNAGLVRLIRTSGEKKSR